MSRSTAQNADGPVLVALRDVRSENVEWLWPRRIARRKVNLLVGDPGTGKTFVALYAAARLSQGDTWADGGIAPKTSTLILTAEDGLADTIRPRLDILGADVGAITALDAVRRAGREAAFSFQKDLPALEDAVRQTRAGLVIVDPLSAYLGKIDSFKDADVRGVLGPLARLAELESVAVLGILHLSKNEERKVLHRVLGSVAFAAAARVVIAVAKDRYDNERRLLGPIKNNLTEAADVLAYRLADEGLVWEPEPVAGTDFEVALSGGSGTVRQVHDEPAKLDIATAFLERVLANGPMQHDEVKQLADLEGIAPRTLARACKRLDVRTERLGGFEDRGSWAWSLPTTQERQNLQDRQADQECQLSRNRDGTAVHDG